MVFRWLAAYCTQIDARRHRWFFEGVPNMNQMDTMTTAVVEALGGANNIERIDHCVTRLRVTVRDDTRVDAAALAGTEGVLDYRLRNGSHQLAIGRGLLDAFGALRQAAGLAETEGALPAPVPGAPVSSATPLTELQKLDAGLPYCFTDPQVAARKQRASALCDRLNALPSSDGPERREVLRELLGTCDDDTSIMSPFACDHGRNIHVGAHFIANYGVTILDIAPVQIGDHCMIGPGTLITTVGHPLDREGRRARLAQAEAVTIGDDVWIGGNVTVLPGVHIGDDVVIGAGSVVTRDIPANSLALGVPARVVRKLEEAGR